MPTDPKDLSQYQRAANDFFKGLEQEEAIKQSAAKRDKRLAAAAKAKGTAAAQRKQAVDTFFSKLQNKYVSTKDERLQRTLKRIAHKKAEPDLPRVKPFHRLSPQSKETWETDARKRIDDPGRARAREARLVFYKKKIAAGRSPGLRDYLANDFMKGWNKIKAIKPGDLPDLD